MLNVEPAGWIVPGGMPTLAQALVLMSAWKPLLLLLPFIPWALFVSKVLDKHAARFFLPRENYNLVHLVIGLVALLVAISMPMKSEAAFWLGWGLMVLLLAGDAVAFAIIHNKDERVPEEFRIRLNTDAFKAGRADKAAKKLQGKAEFTVRGPDKAVVIVPSVDSPEYEVRVAAEAIVMKMNATRASQADIAPTGKDNAYAVSYLIDGVRQAGETLPGVTAIKVMDFWKAAAKLDVNDRRKRLIGDVTVEKETSRKKIRVISIGVQGGMRTTLLGDPEGAVRRKLPDMGLLEPQMADLKAIVEDNTGVVLLAAPLDQGRTTTFYSVIRMHDAYTRNVQTLETEQQDSLEGIRQNKYEPGQEGAEFSTLLRSLYRRDPDVLGLGDLPDTATAKEITRADQDRTRTYVSLRADSAIQAIQVWMKLAADAEAGSKVLRGVVAQKLIRKLCVNCRVAYQPAPEMVKKLGLPPGSIKQLFKKGGQVLVKNKPEVCPVCSGGGYVGQEGCFEVISLDQTARDLIKAGDWDGMAREARRRKLPTIQQTALRKAIDGITSVEEVLRVTGEGGEGKAPPAAAPPPAAPAPAAPVKK